MPTAMAISYVLDGSNGHLLRAKPFVRTNWNSGFDSKGRPMVRSCDGGHA